MSALDFKIQETKMEVFTRDNFQCQYPGCPVMGMGNLQAAHRIAKSKANRKYIKRFFNLKTENQVNEIIHHPLNLKTSCSIHNDSFNCGNIPIARDLLLKEIWGSLKL